MGGFGGLAEGFGHYFCFAEEYSNVTNVISLYYFYGTGGWSSRMEWEAREREVWHGVRGMVPAIIEFLSYFLKSRVSHVVDVEDEYVLVFFEGGLYVCV